MAVLQSQRTSVAIEALSKLLQVEVLKEDKEGLVGVVKQIEVIFSLVVCNKL